MSYWKQVHKSSSLQVLTEGEGADCCLAENGQEAENGKNAEDGSRIEDGAGNKSEKRILPTLCKREAEKIEAELGNLKITAPLAPGRRHYEQKGYRGKSEKDQENSRQDAHPAIRMGNEYRAF